RTGPAFGCRSEVGPLDRSARAGGIEVRGQLAREQHEAVGPGLALAVEVMPARNSHSYSSRRTLVTFVREATHAGRAAPASPMATTRAGTTDTEVGTATFRVPIPVPRAMAPKAARAPTMARGKAT